jgi:hypothetical protein
MDLFEVDTDLGLPTRARIAHFVHEKASFCVAL